MILIVSNNHEDNFIIIALSFNQVLIRLEQDVMYSYGDHVSFSKITTPSIEISHGYLY